MDRWLRHLKQAGIPFEAVYVSTDHPFKSGLRLVQATTEILAFENHDKSRGGKAYFVVRSKQFTPNSVVGRGGHQRDGRAHVPRVGERGGHAGNSHPRRW